MTRGAPRRVLAIAAAAVLLAGCSPRRALVPNLPPETLLFVQGPVDPVGHAVRLYWFGTDPDGEVVGFELRFKNPAAPADTQWTFTTRTDSLFHVFTPDGMTRPVFEVRAIDDHGLRDPSPASNDFTFRNEAPAVRLLSPPRPVDSTYAAITLAWRGIDPDGDAARMSYRVWLDGNEAGARLTTATVLSLAPDDFRQGGALRPGLRTAYVQAIDAGGRASAPDSARWFVRAPVPGSRARLLVIDDVPSSNPANFTIDTLWTNGVRRVLLNPSPGDTTFSILRLEFTQPFRSSADLENTCKLFDAVLWYRSTQISFSTLLRDREEGLRAYLRGGGRLLLEGLNLIEGENASGPLPASWVTEHLGSRDLIRAAMAGRVDSTVSWGISGVALLRSGLSPDTMRVTQIYGGLRGFEVTDPSHIALWAADSMLSPQVPRMIPVGVSVPQPGGGLAMVVTVPLRGAHGSLPPPGRTDGGHAHKFVAAALRRLLGI